MWLKALQIHQTLWWGSWCNLMIQSLGSRPKAVCERLWTWYFKPLDEQTSTSLLLFNGKIMQRQHKLCINMLPYSICWCGDHTQDPVKGVSCSNCSSQDRCDWATTFCSDFLLMLGEFQLIWPFGLWRLIFTGLFKSGALGRPFSILKAKQCWWFNQACGQFA